MKSHGFDMELVYDGETIRAVGTIDQGYPVTGPTYSCGGEPGEPAHVDEVNFYAEDGKEIEDPDCKILDAVEETIMEQASEDAESDKSDAAEHRRDMERDR